MTIFNTNSGSFNDVNITGSLKVSGSMILNGGALVGTSSFATTASYSEKTGYFTGSAIFPAGITASLSGTSSFANETNWSGIRSIPAGLLSSSAQITSLTNVTISGSTIISGSTAGNIVALSIASNTASLNASAGSFYTLLLVSGSTTRVEPTGVVGGRTFTLRVKQASVASGSVVFSSAFKFPTGSAYTATSTANAEDILSFITFDTGSIYAVSTKQMV